MVRRLKKTGLRFSVEHYLALAIILSLTGFIAPITAFAVLIALGIVFLSRFRSFSIIESTVLSFLGTLSSIIVLYSLITVCSVHLPVRFALPVLALTYTLIAGYAILRRGYRPHIDWTLTKSDIAASLVALFCFGMLLIPIINQSGATVAQFLSYGEDNASHYALTRYESHVGQLAYEQNADHVGLIKSLEIYPQGFHISAAVLISLTRPHDINESGFVKIYALFITLFYALFIFWLVKLSTAQRKLSLAVLISFLPALALLGGLSNFILMLDRGFQPQIFAYMFLTAIAYALAKLSTGRKALSLGLYLGLFLCIGIAASWWFMLFVAGVLLFAYGLQTGQLQPFVQQWRQYWIGKVLIVFTIAYPIIINILLNAKKDPISEQGGVDKLPWIILAYLLIPAAIFLVLSVRSFRKRAIQTSDKYLYYTLTGLLASVIMAIIIGSYHKVRLGYFEYFFYKSIYAVLLFAIVLFFITAIGFSDSVFKKMPRNIRWLVPLVVLAVTWIVSVQTNLVYLKVYIHNWFPQTVDAGDAAPLFSEDANKYHDILYMGDCDIASDYLSNRWSGARLLSADYARSELTTAALLHPLKAATLLRSYVQNHHNILLIIDDRCATKTPYLQTITTNQNVTVRHVHTTEVQPATGP